MVVQAFIFKHFDLIHKSFLETDWSNLVTDEIVFQYDDDGVFSPLWFYSKSMIPAECNYHIYDTELFDTIQSFEHFRSKFEHN